VFQPLAMLGGFIWCTGNCMCTPIIQCIGMALGLLIWGACNMITGWCMGEWGLFGVSKDDPPNYPSLNVAGACVALFATSIYFFVKPADQSDVLKSPVVYHQLPSDQVSTNAADTENGVKPKAKRIRKVSSYETFQGVEQESMEGRLQNVSDLKDPILKYQETAQILAGTSWVDSLSPKEKRIAGVVMAVVAGILFGSNMAPPTHLIDDQVHVDGNGLYNSPHGIDYVFSHFTGVLLTSLMWFLVYCVVKKNNPQVNNQVILPGWFSGVVWGIADACWFIANDNLGLTTAYPIITTGPGLVASLWGVCVFGEVTGKRNLMVLMVAFIFSFIAVAMITLSKTL